MGGKSEKSNVTDEMKDSFKKETVLENLKCWEKKKKSERERDVK